MRGKKIAIAASKLVIILLTIGIIMAERMDASFAKSNIKLYDEFAYGNGVYEVTDESELFVEYLYPTKKSSTVTIPDTVKYKGETLRVVSIRRSAFWKNQKLKKITIGSKIVLIGKQAFYNCKNLKDITIKATNLTKSGVKANAFKGINANAVVKVPEWKLSEYQNILKSKGMTGKNQVIKGIEMEKKADPEIIFGSDNPLPNPEHAIAGIGNIAKLGIINSEKSKVGDSAKYSIGDSITFSARVCMDPDIYGTWGVRESYGRWERCLTCGKKFDMYSKNYGIDLHMSKIGCEYHYDYVNEKRVYTEYYWVPDTAPCKTVFHFTLPEGLSYQEESIRVLRTKTIEVDESAYSVKIDGQQLIVTIDDIKDMPFFSYEDYDNNDYGGFRSCISVLFDAEINDSVVAANTAYASVSYSYKGLEQMIDLGNLSVYASTLQIKSVDTSGNLVDGSKFALYKVRTEYNNSNLGVGKYFKIAEASSKDGMITFNGLGKGMYKLEQIETPNGYEEMRNVCFTLSMDGKNGNITKLSVREESESEHQWEVNTKTGVINATLVNYEPLVN